MSSSNSGIPSLGPRGEGWVIGQFALLGLVAVLGLRDHARPHRHGPSAVAGLASMSVGVALAVQGARDLGTNLTPMPRPLQDAQLVETGIYAHIRHPLYAAVMLLAFGWAAAMQSARAVLAAGVLAAWLDAKARREEGWLLTRFPGYTAYRTRTARFLPRLY